MMAQRKYSVEEIDRIRDAVIKRNEEPHPNPYGDQDVTAWAKRVEERVRTYMLNGTDPEELEALVAKIPEFERGPFPADR